LLSFNKKARRDCGRLKKHRREPVR